MASPTIQTLTSFSGADLLVNFANQVIGEMQQITWGIQREKAPVYTMGSADPRSFSRGKRAIAGNVTLAVLDHDSLITAMQHIWNQIAPPAMFTAAGNIAVNNSENFTNALDMIKWNMTVDDAIAADYSQTGYGFSGATALTNVQQEGSNGGPASFDPKDNFYVESWDKGDNINVPAGFSPIRGVNVQYADTLPPVDATLTFANEYGQCAFQKIYDMEFLNEGSGVSVDTTIVERQLTYIARKISPLIKGVYTREDGGTLKGVDPY